MSVYAFSWQVTSETYCCNRCTVIVYRLLFKLLVLIQAFPQLSVFVPHAVEVPLPVDERAFSGPRTLLGGDGGAEILVGGLVGAADEAVGVQDLADEVEGFERDGLPAVVDLLCEEGDLKRVKVY